METKRNSGRQSKSRTWIHSYISLYCGLAVLVLAIGKSLFFYFYLESGGLNRGVGSVWSYLFFCYGGAWAVAFPVVIASLILTALRKSKLRNFILIAFGLLFWFSGWMIGIYSSSGFSFDKGRKVAVRYFFHNEMWLDTMEWIKTQIQKYVQQNDGKLPPAEKWREVLLAFEPNESDYINPVRHVICLFLI